MMNRRLFFILAVLIAGICSAFCNNRALLIGIGNYDRIKTGWNKINGCNDVYLLKDKFKNKGFSVQSLVDNSATKKNIIKSLKKLMSATSDGDTLYIHFSGHGQLIKDFNGDEISGYDQSFICYDACRSPMYKYNRDGYNGENHLIDDELFPYLNEMKRKVGSSGLVIVVFDACYSAGADRGEKTDDPDSQSVVEWSEIIRGTDDEFKIIKSVETYLNSIKKPGDYANDGGTIIIISACECNKKNYECKDRHSGRKYGSLSYCIGKILDKDIPLKEWGEYFRSHEYKKLKIFRPSQTPVVEIYR